MLYHKRVILTPASLLHIDGNCIACPLRGIARELDSLLRDIAHQVGGAAGKYSEYLSTAAQPSPAHDHGDVNSKDVSSALK